ncbi:protein YdgH [Escherichia coli]|uniref:Protein YdgH n=1 Tax=Escherichia coli TaxID=562 RepID=A0A377BCE9_ECOLX|nr:protein YdgH [Escherichia coli]
MKLKNTLLASALLSATAFSVNAATELTPEQAAAVKPFEPCSGYRSFLMLLAKR